ncbi:MAG: SMI1/KNR4 family protein [Desulfovibrio sp.]|nr:SMI1/KNR4 family protein [Desulfovibrio sp.]
MEKFAERYPQFYEKIRDFPDFSLEPGLMDDELEAIEKRLDYKIGNDLKELFKIAATVKMNGLSIKARELGPIVMPSSEALVIGEFYLYHPGDRLLMLPDDPAVYYLEQRNGAITKLANNLPDFFNLTLPRFL